MERDLSYIRWEIRSTLWTQYDTGTGTRGDPIVGERMTMRMRMRGGGGEV